MFLYDFDALLLKIIFKNKKILFLHISEWKVF